MARTGMTAIIQTVRDLTFASTNEFTLGTATYFSDDHIQGFLDEHRREAVFDLMTAIPTQVVGSVTYYDYRTGIGYLETTTAGTAIFSVQDGYGATLSTAVYSVDYTLGRVTFTTNTLGSARYVNYRAYDVYGAAADLLTQWAAREARAFDYVGDRQSLMRSQKTKQLMAMADIYRAQAWVVTQPVRRSDVSGQDW